MNTRFLSRGLFASVVVLALSPFDGEGRAQDILKELEQGQSGHAAQVNLLTASMATITAP